MTPFTTLEARLRTAALRVRCQRALDAFVLAGAAALALAALALAAGLSAPRALRALAWVPAAAALVAASRSVARLPLAIALDQRHGLPDLLSSAWSFAQLDPAHRSPSMEFTLAHAERAAGSVDPGRSHPLRRPRGLGWLALALGAALLGWKLGSSQPPAAAPFAEGAPAAAPEELLSAPELAAYRRRLAELAAGAEGRDTPRAAALRAALERTVDELARAPADRLAVLRRLRSLEARARVLAANDGAEREAAERAAAAWDDVPISSEPLQGGGAEPPPPPPEAETPPPPNPKAAEAPPPRQGRRQDDSELGESESPANAPNRGDARGRPNARPGGGPPPRPVAAAPSSGSSDGPRGPELERRSAKEREQGRALADAIAELRDLVQRDQSLPGDPDDETGGKPRPPRGPKPTSPDRDDSRADRTGSPNAAYASSGPPPESGAAGPGASDEVPPLPAAASRLAGSASDGPVRSQVIYGAAEHGFAGRDYARVHGDYERHAERELERDAIPPGYRSYVRRYFQSIAPRPNR